MKKLATLLLIIATVVPAALADSPAAKWEKEPRTYRGVEFGASPATAKAKITGLACTVNHAATICRSVFKLNDDFPAVQEAWSFTNGKLTGVAVHYPTPTQAKLRSLATIITTRYGEPSARADDLWSWHGEAVNATFDGSILTVGSKDFTGSAEEKAASKF